MDDGSLSKGLNDAARLALAYAPVSARATWVTWLALDSRLATVVRSTREPMLGQMRLAWWRERLGESPSLWPQGEPVLQSLAGWGEGRQALHALVDGWERLLGPSPLAADELAAMARGRAEGLLALADELGESAFTSDIEPAATGWALADLASHLGDPDERSAAIGLLREQPRNATRLPRAMRPLVILHDLARREAEGIHIGPIGGLLRTMRLGMFGR